MLVGFVVNSGAPGGPSSQKVSLGAGGPNFQAKCEMGAGRVELTAVECRLGFPKMVVGPNLPADEINGPGKDGQSGHGDQYRTEPSGETGTYRLGSGSLHGAGLDRSPLVLLFGHITANAEIGGVFF
jgi:hypothetical protein